MSENSGSLAEAVAPWGVEPATDGLNQVGSLQATEILGVPDDAVEGLNFDTAHVFTDEADQPGQSRIIEVRFDGEPVHAGQFLSLLQAAAPVELPGWMDDKRQADGVLADWAVFEQRTSQIRELEALHSGLKGWTQLEREYPDLKAALEPVQDNRPLPWMLPGNEHIVAPANFIDNISGSAEGLASYQPLISGPEMVQLLTDIYGPEETRSRVVEAMSHVSKSVADSEKVNLKGLADDELFDLFVGLDIEKRNQLVSVSDLQGTYREGGRGWSRNAETEKFTALYLERHCVTFETEDGTLMYAHGINPDEDVQEAYAKRQRVYAGSDRPTRWQSDGNAAYECEMMEVETVIGRQSLIIPGTIKFWEIGLIPSVKWSVDPDGKRTYLDTPEHAPFVQYKHDVLSGVAGLMVLAYLQPEKRARWPKQASLPRSNIQQEMGPAQVPLIVLQQAGRLLNNPLIEQAESLL